MRQGSPVFYRMLVGLYLVVPGVFCFFLLTGADYYLTAFEARPRHPDYALYRPAGSYGLRFGIVGSLALVTLLLYSVRRRTGLLGRNIPLKYWLDVHIFLGVIGPLFILLHTSFKWNGIVSLSFWSMVGVAVSGVFGRYLYVQIPRNLYGAELELAGADEVEADLQRHLDGYPELTPEARTRLRAVYEGSLEATTQPLMMIAADLTRFLRTFKARRYLAPLGLSAERRHGLLAGLHLMESRMRTLRRLRVVHKLLHQWHVVHRPFALIMYLIMIVHIAVALLFGFSWR